ncbi:hypothetical protein IJ182_03695 [bacterium]|nr:hypothetical protein [bacterium]
MSYRKPSPTGLGISGIHKTDCVAILIQDDFKIEKKKTSEEVWYNHSDTLPHDYINFYNIFD